MFEDTINSLRQSRGSFEEKVQDSFGRSINDKVFDPADNELGRLEGAYSECVSLDILDGNGIKQYESSRGLNMAISEYAPGKIITIDKKDYKIGGIFSSRELRYGELAPARKFFAANSHYIKKTVECTKCGWLGLHNELTDKHSLLCDTKM